MRNSRVSKVSRRWIFVVAAAAVLIFLLGFFVGVNNMNEVEARDYRQNQKYYTSVEVEEGDTLWSISEEYMTSEYNDRNEYMNEVCAINHISADEIHAGQYIVVPYYSAEALK